MTPDDFTDEPLPLPEVTSATRAAPNAVLVRQAKDFVGALKDGASPEDAAEAVGKPLSTLSRSPFVLKELEALQHYWFPNPKVRKTVTDLIAMREAFEAEASRDRLTAIKILREDPELGIVQGQAQVQINILSPELQQLDPGKVFADEDEEDEQ